MGKSRLLAVGEIKYFSQSIIIDTGAGKGGYLSLIDLTNDKTYSTS